MSSNDLLNDKLLDLLKEINNEFENVEDFIEADKEKCERFKHYLKCFYDYIKIQDDNDYIQSITTRNKSNNKNVQSSQLVALPELIIDKNLVDLEQIYQQLQLYNQNFDQTSSASLNSLTKFFSKCLVQIDSLTFNLDLNKSFSSKANNATTQNNNAKTLSGSSLSNEDSLDAEADAEEDEDDDDDEDDQDEDNEDDLDDDDSIDNLIQYSKNKLKQNDKKEKSNFGIPDGSDSEISDFEVDENGQNDDDDDDDQEADADENDEENNDEEIDQDEDLEDNLENGKQDDIDSDEVDDDLVDLYQDLGDEKEVLGIGKPSKGFDEVDFDREDFGIDGLEAEQDDLDDDDVDNKKSKKQQQKEQKQTKDLFDVDDSNKTDENVNKSSFEIRQEKLKEKIDEIHEDMLKNVTDKPWQMSGEVSAKTRPQDSLLEEYLQFDHMTRQAPVYSASTTEELEKMIKQRIKDKAFDDVERKVKPVEMQYEYKKQVVLNNEKSKLGLGDVYEQEYLKQQQKELGTQDDDTPKEVASNPKHEEIRKQMQSLFIKLDALSNFHFTPKAPIPEIKVVSNMPTIAMEEVAPVNVADANMLAPEEVRAKINALPKSKSEETKADKNRNLRVKKLISKRKKIDREKRLQIAQALDPNNVKVNKEIAMNKLKKQAKNLSKNIKILKHDKNEKSDKAYKSSSAFFKHLQENSQLSKSKVANSKKKASDENTKNSKKLKL